METRPMYRVGAAGLEPRDWRLVEIVFKHSQYNPYEFVLAPTVVPEAIDILIVNPVDQAGAQAMARVRASQRQIPVVEALPRGEVSAARYAIAIDRLTLQLLSILNRVVDTDLSSEGARASTDVSRAMTAPTVSSAGLLPVPSKNYAAAVPMRPSIDVDDPAARGTAPEPPKTRGTTAAAPTARVEPTRRPPEATISGQAGAPLGFPTLIQPSAVDSPSDASSRVSSGGPLGNRPLPSIAASLVSPSQPASPQAMPQRTKRALSAQEATSQGATTQSAGRVPNRSSGVADRAPAGRASAAPTISASMTRAVSSPPSLASAAQVSALAGRREPTPSKAAAQRSNLVAFPSGTAVDVRVAQAPRLQVLVVDDSPTVRQQLSLAFERMGMRCLAVDSAVLALQRLANQHFDLVLADVVMPDMDGYKLTREIKRNKQMRQIPVIILTSKASPFDLARGALAGCDSYLSKPVPMRALEAAVVKQLRKSLAIDDLSALMRTSDAVPGGPSKSASTPAPSVEPKRRNLAQWWTKSGP